MQLEEAKELIRGGAMFGDVVDQVDDPAALREWFVSDPSVPNLAARGAILHTSEMKCSYVSDKPCHLCGSDIFMPGRCPTCVNCGESAGGCS